MTTLKSRTDRKSEVNMNVHKALSFTMATNASAKTPALKSITGALARIVVRLIDLLSARHSNVTFFLFS